MAAPQYMPRLLDPLLEPLLGEVPAVLMTVLSQKWILCRKLEQHVGD
ncbi:MAG: hypothetical protein GXP55_21915 [Deltaproteobacteria bacterium]|nr:hypothetical protein [Deltaproteobacteria bacterium]